MPYAHYYITLMRRLRAVWSVFLDLLAPPRHFEAAVNLLTLEDLQDAVVSGESALPYHAREVTALVWELKYRKNARAAALAGAYLAEELLAIASEELGAPLLIPVPMHAARRKERGYNQTELLCEAVLNSLRSRVVLGGSAVPLFERNATRLAAVNEERGISLEPLEYVPEILVRTHPTPPQQGLPKHERLRNLKNSIAVVRPEKINGRVCVVVDDVTTTGATFKECERALKSAGARSVHCVALARS